MRSGPPLGSTYRLQLNGLGFSGAQALVPYFDQLGIETLYVSPVLAAAPGSTHGYDVVDPSRLDSALGSAEDFESLLQELAAHDMRMLLDIVPNHMAAVPSNRWWWETQRMGEGSEAARAFDVDWSQHGGRVLLPVLSRPLALVAEEASVREGPDGAILEMDGQQFPLSPGSAAGVAIPELLDAQHFRPAFWRSGDTDGNYRRFFNIDGLVGVRVEDNEVFARTHELILRLCADERIAGVRVDHIDGLWDPTRYLANLANSLHTRGRRPIVLVEKILGRDETIDDRWAVDGTTGYEFADRAGGLFLEEAGCRDLLDIGSALTGEHTTFEKLGLAGKREMLDRTFAAQLDRVARLVLSALDAEHPGHDLALIDVRRAVVDLTASLDVYRTYLDDGPATEGDTATVARAMALLSTQERRQPELERALSLIAGGLVDHAGGGSPWRDVAGRWQQLTGAVMAKGVEDTATYRYDGLLSHADVGCDPDRAACGSDEFHRFVRRRVRTSGSEGLNATSTHDSKRNEDARCRLAVLSEANGEWGRLVRRWHRRLAPTRRRPQPHDELVVYQTLFALWPVHGVLGRGDVRRVRDYVLKAAREAGRFTSWTEPDVHYERLLGSFVTRVSGEGLFQGEMGRLVRAIAPAAISNSLALTVLKTCVPGVPDFFQGTELFEATLTDPDNRRMVDYTTRESLLRSLPAPETKTGDLETHVTRMLADWPNGQLKLHVIRTLLRLRRELSGVFGEGSYEPLSTSGSRAENIVAWSRRRGGNRVVAIVPRLTLRHAGRGRFPTGARVWGATTCSLPRTAPHSYVDVLTGRTLRANGGRLEVANALALLPVAVLRGT